MVPALPITQPERTTVVPPNIVFVMSDQQRWDSLGCYGNAFASTPHLDRMASEGMRFETCTSPWPVCTPSRASMWTGVYPHVHGLDRNLYGIGNAVRDSSPITETVFDRMRAAGYATAYIGKWHLGEDDPGMFDTWMGFNSQGGHWQDGQLDGIYNPDLQTDQAIAYIRERAEKSDQPFMVVNSFYPPHDPYTAPQKYYEPYRGKGVPFVGYYAAVSALDANVGRMLDAIDEAGIAENTIVMYCSDHGDTFKFRPDGMHKHVCHEESIRVPMIVRWPERVSAGSVVEAPVGLIDLLPTLLECAGENVPDHAQGKSFLPWLEGRTPKWDDVSYIETNTRYEGHDQRCLRTSKWKLVLGTTGPNHLFDLERDPEEVFDLYDAPESCSENMPTFPSHAHVIAELVERMDEVARGLDDDVGRRAAERSRQELTQRRARGVKS